MSKKEFVKAAAIVRAAAARDAKTAGAVMAAFVLLFQDVPRFDLPRFVKACGIAEVIESKAA